MRFLLTFSTHGFLLTTYYPLLIDHIQLALRFVPLYFRTLYFFFHVRGAPFRTLLRRRAAPRHHSWPRRLHHPGRLRRRLPHRQIRRRGLSHLPRHKNDPLA